MKVVEILMGQPAGNHRRPLGRRLRCTCLCLVALLMGVLAPQVRASVIPYSVAAFQLSNDNADGAAVVLNAGLALMLTGGNNGTGLSGTSDFLATAVAAGAIEFQYTYNSLDAPGFDSAGYMIQGLFIQLTDTGGDSGTASFTVAAGDVFGFRVATFDNTQEPGVLTISDFAVGAASAPEPATLPVMAAAFVLAAFIRRKLRHHREELP
jgi:hypothetical protein